jgi:ketosteroid isomerase-like protein
MDGRTLVETYHDAWTRGDFAAARRCLADDLDFRGSIDAFERADDFVAALGQFQGMLTEVKLLRAFFDDRGAALLYDCVTATPAGTIRTAEFFGVSDGRIREIRLVFDASALRAAMQR